MQVGERRWPGRVELMVRAAALPPAEFRVGRGWRKAVAALATCFMKKWVGLYAPPPRRLGPFL